MMQALYAVRSDRQQRVEVASVATLDPFAFALRRFRATKRSQALADGFP